MSTGKVALADHDFRLAEDAFRLVLDHASSPSTETNTRLTEFIQENGTVPLSEKTKALLTRCRAGARGLRQRLDERRSAYYDVRIAEDHLDAAEQLLDADFANEADKRIQLAADSLSESKLAIEPTGLKERFPVMPRDYDYSAVVVEYEQAVKTKASVATRLKLLEYLDRDTKWSIRAERIRYQGITHANRGEFADAVRCAEDLFFLQRVYGASWRTESMRPEVARASDDPMVAVTMLFSAALLKMVPPKERRAGAAEWLISAVGPSNKIKKATLEQALAGEIGNYSDPLGRVLVVAWGLNFTDDELAIGQSLKRMSLWEPELGWLAERLTSALRVDRYREARSKLSAVLTRSISVFPDWILSVLDRLWRGGRPDTDLPINEINVWRNVSRNLSAFASAMAAGQALQRDILLRLLAHAQYDQAIGHGLKSILAGIHKAIAALEFVSEKPQVSVTLEESASVVRDGLVRVVIAIANTGVVGIHHIELGSQTGSELLPGDANDPVYRVAVLLVPGQVEIVSIPCRIRGSVGDTKSLGLRVSFDGHDGQRFEHLPQGFVVTLRRPSEILSIDRRTLFGLFSQDGAEVTDRKKNFYGRGTEIDDLISRLIVQERSELTLIGGMRRVGKTSLAKVFLSVAAEEYDSIGVFVDFKQYADHSDEQALGSRMQPWRTLGFLASRILDYQLDGVYVREFFGYSGFGWRDELLSTFRDSALPADLLRDMLCEIAGLVSCRVFLIVIDELDFLANYWSEGGYARGNVSQLFNVLRGLSSEKDGALGKFRWLLCGSDVCEQMFSDYTNPLYGSISKIELKEMTQDETFEMLDGPLRRLEGEPVSMSEQAKIEMFELTRGFPYFVNVLGRNICSIIADEPVDLISRRHVRWAVDQTMPSSDSPHAPPTYGRVLEPVADHPERPILLYVMSVISHYTRTEEPFLSFDDVVRLSEELVGGLGRSCIQEAVSTLLSFRMLESISHGEHLQLGVRLPLIRRLIQVDQSHSLLMRKEYLRRYLLSTSQEELGE